MAWNGMRRTTALSLFSAVVGCVSAQAADPLDFNRDIRPILSENCFYCHGQDANKRQADLQLHIREAAIASGAIVPSDPVMSSLVARIMTENPDEVMPP